MLMLGTPTDSDRFQVSNAPACRVVVHGVSSFSTCTWCSYD